MTRLFWCRIYRIILKVKMRKDPPGQQFSNNLIEHCPKRPLSYIKKCYKYYTSKQTVSRFADMAISYIGYETNELQEMRLWLWALTFCEAKCIFFVVNEMKVSRQIFQASMSMTEVQQRNQIDMRSSFTSTVWSGSSSYWGTIQQQLPVIHNEKSLTPDCLALQRSDSIL